MYLTNLSIKRPVVATVMSLVLVIFGLVTFNKIPLRELPDVDSAKINIRTDYVGASAVIIDTQITQKIEDRIGGTPGIVTINSTSEDGRSSITLEFKLKIFSSKVLPDLGIPTINTKSQESLNFLFFEFLNFKDL